MRLNSTIQDSTLSFTVTSNYFRDIADSDVVANRCNSLTLENDIRRRDLIAFFFSNPEEAKKNDSRFPANVPPGVDMAAIIKDASKMSPVEFYNAVRNGGLWDWKQIGSEHGKYAEFGNWAYGVESKAFSWGVLPEEFFLRGAGWAQERAGNYSEGFGHWYDLKGSFGDDPADQAWIR